MRPNLPYSARRIRSRLVRHVYLWGNGRRVTSTFTGRADQVDALLVQPDSKIVAIGLIATDNTGNTPIALTCFLGH